MEILSEQLESLRITKEDALDRMTEIKTMNEMSIILVPAKYNKTI